jgi:inner membrane protein
MDPITHTMTGAALARVGLDRRSTRAATTLMLAANAPDIDIVSVWLGGYASIAIRRGWTHGPVAMLLLPLAVAALVIAWDRWVARRDPAHPRVDARWTLLLATIGVLSHPMLDWLNTYGIRLLMPFSTRWFAGDAVFIVDPWLWLLLAVTLLLTWRRAARGPARVTAALALGYVLAMVTLSPVAERRTLAQVQAQGAPDASEVMYQPLPATPHRAAVIVVTPTSYRTGSFHWFRDPQLRLDAAVLARGDWTSARVARARQDTAVRDFLTWSRYPYLREEADGTLFFGDARFPEGGITGALGGVRVVVD